jgi:hypothetical protein
LLPAGGVISAGVWANADIAASDATKGRMMKLLRMGILLFVDQERTYYGRLQRLNRNYVLKSSAAASEVVKRLATNALLGRTGPALQTPVEVRSYPTGHSILPATERKLSGMRIGISPKSTKRKACVAAVC